MMLSNTNTQHLVRASVYIFLVVLCLWLCTSTAHARTITVSPQPKGQTASIFDFFRKKSDFYSIQKAERVAKPGDVIEIMPGEYEEDIEITTPGITIRASDPDNPPIITGEGEFGIRFKTPKYSTDTNRLGVSVAHAQSNSVIEGLVVTNKRVGIGMNGHSNVTIRNNQLHHIQHRAIEIVNGSNVRVENNVIYMVGNSGESSGVQFVHTSNSQIIGNQIYLSRKQCIRARGGSNVLIESNVVAFCGNSGIALNSTAGGAKIFNNYVYGMTALGLELKHLNDNGSSQWNQVWHNTIFNSGGSNVEIGVNSPALSHLDLRNNIFSGGSHMHIRNPQPNLVRNLILDYNIYHSPGGRPSILYSERWAHDGYTSLNQIQSARGYDRNSRYSNASVAIQGYQLDALQVLAGAGGAGLSSRYGRQIGARGLSPQIPFLQNLNESIWNTTGSNAVNLIDGQAQSGVTGVWTGSGCCNQVIQLHLNQIETFHYVIITPGGHNRGGNPRTGTLEVSEFGNSWRTIAPANSGDDKGSPNIYEIPGGATGRQVRYTIHSTYSGGNAIVEEIQVLSSTGGASGIPAEPLGEPCHTITTQAVPQEFASPIGESSRIVIALAFCPKGSSEAQIVAGDGRDASTVVWPEAYYATGGTTWTKIDMRCGRRNGSYCAGSGFGKIQLNSNGRAVFATYVCEYRNQQWLCGGRKWRLQSVQRP